MPDAFGEHAGLVWEADPLRAVEQADIIVLLVDHDRFRDIPLSALDGKAVIDTRGFWPASVTQRYRAQDQAAPLAPALKRELASDGEAQAAPKLVVVNGKQRPQDIGADFTKAGQQRLG
jgi:hypothetical protein